MNRKRNCKRPGYRIREIDRRAIIFILGNKLRNQSDTTIMDLNNKFRLTSRQIYYLVNKLVNRGYVRNIGSGIKLLEPTQKARDYMINHFEDLQSNGSYVNSFFDRAHNITITQPIIFRPKGVNLPGFEVSKKSNKLHWDSPQLTKIDNKKGITMRITPKTVVYCFKERYGKDPHHLVNICLNQCFKISQWICSYGFKLDLPNIAIIGQHHAIFNKELAKFTQRYKIFYKSDRLTFDLSIRPGEFELINPNYSSDDFLRLTDFFEAVIRGKILVDDLIELHDLLPKLKKHLKLLKILIKQQITVIQ